MTLAYDIQAEEEWIREMEIDKERTKILNYAKELEEAIGDYCSETGRYTSFQAWKARPCKSKAYFCWAY